MPLTFDQILNAPIESLTAQLDKELRAERTAVEATMTAAAATLFSRPDLEHAPVQGVEFNSFAGFARITFTDGTDAVFVGLFVPAQGPVADLLDLMSRFEELTVAIAANTPNVP